MRFTKPNSSYIRQELECDKASTEGVLCFVDKSHPTTAEFLDDAVVGNGLPHRLGRSGHWRECYGEVSDGST